MSLTTFYDQENDLHQFLQFYLINDGNLIPGMNLRACLYETQVARQILYIGCFNFHNLQSPNEYGCLGYYIREKALDWKCHLLGNLFEKRNGVDIGPSFKQAHCLIKGAIIYCPILMEARCNYAYIHLRFVTKDGPIMVFFPFRYAIHDLIALRYVFG